MPITLGLDGKRRAVQANIPGTVGTITTVYAGLLQSAPANMDGMDLATLVGAGQGNEFPVNANFYSARLAVTFDAVTTSATGAVTTTNMASPVLWTNTSGSTKTVAAWFLTDAASGTTGNVLWVGTPDAAPVAIVNTKSARIAATDLLLKVD